MTSENRYDDFGVIAKSIVKGQENGAANRAVRISEFFWPDEGAMTFQEQDLLLKRSGVQNAWMFCSRDTVIEQNQGGNQSTITFN
ncbi:MAG: hypothetical protein JWO20_858 [Candidatus Angelobacter sp.]|jgi:hypothetical protein|nr:hypothetical protein [Candidatus Angelobacter sp.]